MRTLYLADSKFDSSIEMERDSDLPTTSASNDIHHDGEPLENEIGLQIAVREPVLERANSSHEFLGTSPKISGPLGSYHRGTAIRMVTDYLSDLTTLNNINSPDENVLRRVEDNRAFLKELTEANQREPNGSLTWQERNKLSLMMKDYQSALMETLEDKDDEDVTEEDVEFIAEKDVCDGVPLYSYEANFSDGEYVESLPFALDICEAQVREFKIMLPAVKVFQRQCKNLVEALEPIAENNFERCHKVLDALKRLEVDGGAVSSGSQYDSARFCFESLIGLARKFQVVVDLFRNCASENLHKTALKLADLPASPSMPKRWSEFSLAIRNCEWSMDLVEFAFYTLEKLLAGDTHIFQDVSFKWSEEKSRMILQIQSRLGRLSGRLERLGRQDSRLAKSLLDHSKELETKDLTDLIEKLKQLGEPARGGRSKWILGGLFSTRAAFDTANVASFLSVKLAGPIPHARYLPWTFGVDPDSLKFKEYLDSGGAGMVGKYTWFGENVAVKNVRSPGLTRHKFEEEAAILATVQHPNVVRLIGCGFIEKNKTGMLVMELMDHDLRTVIEDRVHKLGSGCSPFPTLVAIDIILQIAQAMEHLRDHKVLHRDLKAKNVLVNICEPLNLGGKSSTSMMPRPDVPCFLPYMQASYVAKLADFGLAKCRPHSSWVRTRMAGTTGWRAPEVFHVHDTEVTREYKWPADVYSFAMTCYEILTGELPFANLPNQAIHENVMAGKRPEGLDALDIPDLLKELIKKCWATNSSERPPFDEIVKSLWECRVKAIVPIFERHITSSSVVSRSASNFNLRN